MDLVFRYGRRVADAFRDDYERLLGGRLEHLWFFDPYRGVLALPQYELWLEGYHDLGRRDLRPWDVGHRLRAFLRDALRQSRC